MMDAYKLDKTELLNIITAYKKSAAFISAYKIRLFQTLFEGNNDIHDVADKINVDETSLLILLNYLKTLELVYQENENWYLSDNVQYNYDLLDNMEPIISYEENLFGNWISPSSIIEVLQSQPAKRRFDLEGFSDQLQSLYQNVMYGKNLGLIALLIKRMIKTKNTSIIEYGRSDDCILKALNEQGVIFDGYYLPHVGSSHNQCRLRSYSTGEFVDNQKGDFILIYNTIHYYNQERIIDFFNYLEKMKKDTSKIIVIDLFMDKDNIFTNGILIDWLTHGGMYYITVKDVIQLFAQHGYILEHNKEISAINTFILKFAKEQKHEN